MAYNPEMEKLKALQLLTQKITEQYGGGNDVKSVNPQNEAFAQGARQLGLTDAQITQEVQNLPWNDQGRAIPAQMPMTAQGLMADELAPAPADAVSGTIPAPAVQAPMPAPQQAAAPQGQPSFFQRMGQRFDQAATGGIIDPTTLTKDQRRMLRGQLLMNVGGALSQNRPIGEGFQQQYNMLTKRQADEQAKQIEATRKNILSGADISTKEGVMAVLPKLAQAGLQDDLFKFANYAQAAFPNDVVIQQNDQGIFVLNKGEPPFLPDGSFNPNFATLIPGTTPQPKGMTEYERNKIALERLGLDIKQDKTEGKAKWTPVALRDYTGLSGDLSVGERLDTTLSDTLALFNNPNFELGPIKNKTYEALNYAGTSTQESRAYSKLTANLSKLRNDSLRLNKGAQTEGDAIRAWEEIAANPNDTEVIKSRLMDIQRYNAQAAEEKRWAMSLYENTYEAVPARPGVSRSAPATNNNDDALVNKYLQ